MRGGRRDDVRRRRTWRCVRVERVFHRRVLPPMTSTRPRTRASHVAHDETPRPGTRTRRRASQRASAPVATMMARAWTTSAVAFSVTRNGRAERSTTDAGRHAAGAKAAHCARIVRTISTPEPPERPEVLDVDALALQLAAHDGRDEHGLEAGARGVSAAANPAGPPPSTTTSAGAAAEVCGGAAAPSAASAAAAAPRRAAAARPEGRRRSHPPGRRRRGGGRRGRRRRDDGDVGRGAVRALRCTFGGSDGQLGGGVGILGGDPRRVGRLRRVVLA